jgi:hypothetical protein
LEGSFNVNSTSVEAWRALLGTYFGLKDGIDGGNPAESAPIHTREAYLTGPIHYTTESVDTQANTFGGDSVRDYSRFFGGSRYLTAAQIDVLAERIVDEVRARGPFLSLADFVNRRLVAPDNFDKTVSGYDPFIGLQGLNGALQRALNLSGVNGGDNAPVEIAQDRVFNMGDAPVADRNVLYPNNNYHYLDAEHRAGVPGGSPHRNGVAGVSETGQLFAHVPGFVTQADLLTVLGSALNARSDTFVIRSYGDLVNPVSGRIDARAWCEAVVQRMPAEVETASFGRRFEIINFRWLNKDEI